MGLDLKSLIPFAGKDKDDLGNWETWVDPTGTIVGGGDDGLSEEEAEARQAALDSIINIGSGPSYEELMGLQGMGGTMPDEYYDQWLQDTYGDYSGGFRPPENRASTMTPDEQAYYDSLSPEEQAGMDHLRGILGPVIDQVGIDELDGMSIGGMATIDTAPGHEGTALSYEDWLAKQDADALRTAAQEAYVQEQMANDPFFGLQQHVRPEMADAAADPYSIEMQRRALDQFADIYAQGGYTEAERAQMRLAQMDAARFEQSQRGAIEQQAAMRGMGHSGTSLASMLSAQQGSANRAAQSADQIAIAGQMRALQALSNQGMMARDMRAASWGEDTTRRGAVDDWNRRNTDLRNWWTVRKGDAAQQGYDNDFRYGVAGANAQLGHATYLGAEQDKRDAEDDWLFNTAVGAGSTYLTGSPAAGQAITGSSDTRTNNDPNTGYYFGNIGGGNTGLY